MYFSGKIFLDYDNLIADCVIVSPHQRSLVASPEISNAIVIIAKAHKFHGKVIPMNRIAVVNYFDNCTTINFSIKFESRMYLEAFLRN